MQSVLSPSGRWDSQYWHTRALCRYIRHFVCQIYRDLHKCCTYCVHQHLKRWISVHRQISILCDYYVCSFLPSALHKSILYTGRMSRGALVGCQSKWCAFPDLTHYRVNQSWGLNKRSALVVLACVYILLFRGLLSKHARYFSEAPPLTFILQTLTSGSCPIDSESFNVSWPKHFGVNCPAQGHINFKNLTRASLWLHAPLFNLKE